MQFHWWDFEVPGMMETAFDLVKLQKKGKIRNIGTVSYTHLEDIQTVAVGAVVIPNDDVSEADVYNFCYGVFENLDSITASHAKGAELSLEYATSVTAVPYHPGAAKYFAEKGIEVPTK